MTAIGVALVVRHLTWSDCVEPEREWWERLALLGIRPGIALLFGWVLTWFL